MSREDEIIELESETEWMEEGEAVYREIFEDD